MFRGGAVGIAGDMLPVVLLSLLVVHKCVTDGLSRFTRMSGVPYSATTASIIGELVKIPILTIAILIFEGKDRIGAIVREAISDSPLLLMLPVGSACPRPYHCSCSACLSMAVFGLRTTMFLCLRFHFCVCFCFLSS